MTPEARVTRISGAVDPIVAIGGGSGHADTCAAVIFNRAQIPVVTGDGLARSTDLDGRGHRARMYLAVI